MSERCRFCGADLEPIPPEVFFPGLRPYLCEDCRLRVVYAIRHELLEALETLGFISKKGNIIAI